MTHGAMKTAALVGLSMLCACAPRVWLVRGWRGGAVIAIQGSGREAARLFADETRSVCGIRDAEIIARQAQSESSVCSLPVPQSVQTSMVVYSNGQTYTGHATSSGLNYVPSTCTEQWMEYTVRCVD